MAITKYDYARLIGSRALQIAQGAPLKIDLSDEKLKELGYDPIKIAVLEYEANVIPLEILND